MHLQKTGKKTACSVYSEFLHSRPRAEMTSPPALLPYALRGCTCHLLIGYGAAGVEVTFICHAVMHDGGHVWYSELQFPQLIIAIRADDNNLRNNTILIV